MVTEAAPSAAEVATEKHTNADTHYTHIIYINPLTLMPWALPLKFVGLYENLQNSLHSEITSGKENCRFYKIMFCFSYYIPCYI